VPEHINPAAVGDYLSSLPGVSSVHDLHIWAMSTTEVALTAHLVVPASRLEDARLATACKVLHDRFGIEHCTLQCEQGDAAHPCAQASLDVV
ncbi:MAG: cation transporter, partial [Gemmatimonadota bacterium]|nr:cation transporter [Gemmatimonadota bacterium]